MKGNFVLNIFILILSNRFCESYYYLLDQGNCSDGEFECSSGKCIPENKLCSSSTECDDGMDERACYCIQFEENIPCDWGENCISEEEFCQKPDDCPEFIGRVDCSSLFPSTTEIYQNSTEDVTSIPSVEVINTEAITEAESDTFANIIDSTTVTNSFDIIDEINDDVSSDNTSDNAIIDTEANNHAGKVELSFATDIPNENINSGTEETIIKEEDINNSYNSNNSTQHLSHNVTVDDIGVPTIMGLVSGRAKTYPTTISSISNETEITEMPLIDDVDMINTTSNNTSIDNITYNATDEDIDSIEATTTFSPTYDTDVAESTDSDTNEMLDVISNTNSNADNDTNNKIISHDFTNTLSPYELENEEVSNSVDTSSTETNNIVIDTDTTESVDFESSATAEYETDSSIANNLIPDSSITKAERDFSDNRDMDGSNATEALVNRIDSTDSFTKAPETDSTNVEDSENFSQSPQKKVYNQQNPEEETFVSNNVIIGAAVAIPSIAFLALASFYLARKRNTASYKF